MRVAPFKRILADLNITVHQLFGEEEVKGITQNTREAGTVLDKIRYEREQKSSKYFTWGSDIYVIYKRRRNQHSSDEEDYDSDEEEEEFQATHRAEARPRMALSTSSGAFAASRLARPGTPPPISLGTAAGGALVITLDSPDAPEAPAPAAAVAAPAAVAAAVAAPRGAQAAVAQATSAAQQAALALGAAAGNDAGVNLFAKILSTTVEAIITANSETVAAKNAVIAAKDETIRVLQDRQT
jgi:hypothetical protein